jgi:heme/copper-type cytochrome/quinol oxidase subunit 2
MNDYYFTAIIIWLWIICSWSTFQTFSDIYTEKWQGFNFLTKTLAFIFGPVILTFLLFSSDKNHKVKIKS